MPTADERRQLRVIARDLGKFTERAVIGISLDVAANLKQDPHTSETGTPVDTGWARGNWIPSIGRPTDEPVGSPDNVAPALDAQASGEAAVLGYRLSRGKVFVSNNVPYINRLNEGHSPQQQPGFVQRAIRKAVDAARRFRP